MKFIRRRFISLLFKSQTILCGAILLLFGIVSVVYPLHGAEKSSFIPFDSNDLIERCLIDDTPCFSDVNQSLERYFSTLTSKFPSLLNYRPRVDCENGRYLLLNDNLRSHVYHGTGSQLMWYLGVLNVAFELNLTLIHLEWASEHDNDESNSERENYFRFFNWEISASEFEKCPLNSSVRKNLFRSSLIGREIFDQRHNGKERFQLKSKFRDEINKFLEKKPIGSSGWTFYSARTFTTVSSLMDVGAVFETRWWLEQRKIYQNDHRNIQPVDVFRLSKKNERKSFVCPRISRAENLLIGVHIRQGDVVRRDKSGRIIDADLYRYISSGAFSSLLSILIKDLNEELQDRYFITIYSEGQIEDFRKFMEDLIGNLTNVRCRVAFFLNRKTSETFDQMLREDVLLVAHSTFSMAAGIFNSRQLKIGPIHNRARVHGMRNFFALKLDANHTKFSISPVQRKQIQQRINEVFREKQNQRSTPVPLWLKNYRNDFPQEFVLI